MLSEYRQLAMSVFYNQDITKERKRQTPWPHCCSQRRPTWLGPASWTCYHGGQERHFCRECSKVGTAWETALPPTGTLPSARVTTGGLSAHISRWKVRCHLLWIDGSQPPVHTQLLGIVLRSHNDKKAKGHFLARQWSSFLSYLSLLVPGPITKVIIWGKSGQPLEC
jgi:hypothetical protein